MRASAGEAHDGEKCLESDVATATARIRLVRRRPPARRADLAGARSRRPCPRRAGPRRARASSGRTTSRRRLEFTARPLGQGVAAGRGSRPSPAAHPAKSPRRRDASSLHGAGRPCRTAGRAELASSRCDGHCPRASGAWCCSGARARRVDRPRWHQHHRPPLWDRCRPARRHHGRGCVDAARADIRDRASRRGEWRRAGCHRERRRGSRSERERPEARQAQRAKEGSPDDGDEEAGDEEGGAEAGCNEGGRPEEACDQAADRAHSRAAQPRLRLASGVRVGGRPGSESVRGGLRARWEGCLQCDDPIYSIEASSVMAIRRKDLPSRARSLSLDGLADRRREPRQARRQLRLHGLRLHA